MLNIIYPLAITRTWWIIIIAAAVVILAVALIIRGCCKNKRGSSCGVGIQTADESVKSGPEKAGPAEQGAVEGKPAPIRHDAAAPVKRTNQKPVAKEGGKAPVKKAPAAKAGQKKPASNAPKKTAGNPAARKTTTAKPSAAGRTTAARKPAAKKATENKAE